MTNTGRGTAVAVLLAVLVGIVGYKAGTWKRLAAAINGSVTVPS